MPVPGILARVSLWLITHILYRVRLMGAEHVPTSGPALLIGNHVSWADALLIRAAIRRPVRFLVHTRYAGHPWLGQVLRWLHATPVSARTSHDLQAAITLARTQLQQGHLVCIFTEGAVHRTDDRLPFAQAFPAILDGLQAPVVPVYVDRTWGGALAFRGHRLFWHRPVRLRFPVTVGVGAALPASTPATAARLALMELGSEVAGRRHAAHETLPWHFVRSARRHFFRLAMADSTGRSMTFGRALVAALLLAQWLRRTTPGQTNIGLLLPSTVGGALANVATSLSGKVPVNLNFTAGTDVIAHAVARCQLKTILTSRAFLERIAMAPLPGMVFLEDVIPTLSKPLALARWLLAALLLPTRVLVRLAGCAHLGADDVATVIFSSGSTGTPKGIVLSHRNILSNLDAVEQVIEHTPTDVLIGVLPFFHSFGYTGTLWFPLIGGFRVVYHPNPTDAKTIGELAHTHHATLLISTPTFCGAYARKCEPEQFAHLRYAIVGAEKLRAPVARAFKERFGVDLLEGYGCTELAPVVSANMPEVTLLGESVVSSKTGSVGHPIPGVVVKVVDVESGEGPLVGTEGLLLVKGPNRMLGYLDDPDRTQEAIREGWYVTGDIAIVDEDGFIFITDRLARFSKIAGEMVPHGRIEEVISTFLAESHAAVVTSVPDDARGERLVAFFTDPALTPLALWEHMSSTDLPKLWIPKREDLRQVDTIPVLGTGKVDLRAVRQLALTGLPE